MPACPVCASEVEVIGGRVTQHDACPGFFQRIDWAGDPTSEARFTDPNDYCPHPERWHSDDADSTEHEVSDLVAAFVRALQPDVVLETGTAWGATARCIGDVLDRSGAGHLHTLEPNPQRAHAARERLRELPVTVHEIKSLDFDPPQGPIGFAWFDSLPELRVPEFRHFYPSLAPGAIVGFHDTAPHHGRALYQAILDMEAGGLLLPIKLRTPRGVVFAEVVR